MAFCVVQLSNGGRQRCATVLRAALIAQLVLSICLIIFCYNASMHVLLLLMDIQKMTVLLLYGLILFHAYCMKLHYTSGLRLTSLIAQYPYWPRVKPLCRVWLILGSLLAINGMLVCVACEGTLKGLMKDLSVSLKVGITQYLTEPTWKSLWDTMQIELHCCGVEKPNDWHEIPWINMDFLNEDSEVVLSLAGADGKILPPVTPYSCCESHVLAACYHDPLQQWSWRDAWSDRAALAAASLQSHGCADAVWAPLKRAVFALHCFNSSVLALQVLIVILARVLSTSARSAALSGDLSGPGLGYLFGPPPKFRSSQRPIKQTDFGASSSASVQNMSLLKLDRRRRKRRLQPPSYTYLT